ncbi:MAG: S9 family peptidase [Candidatus Eisenbacteria bacterium]|uniref:S9 family peptidase n=1 Tax=Eiseniibacteriota bacterium TaxID=2212470 RepID=A0A7Y2EB55_UNCEI|nr:S9 family peptidase [Candidatus Eisenbacteria bacterium]
MTDLIPRSVLFGNPEKISPRLSPDGQRLAYLAPDEGVMNVWVRSRGQQDDRPVTQDRGRGIQAFFWAKNNQQLLYIQDKNGDENWHIFAVGLDGPEAKDLTPIDGVQAQVLAVEDQFPDEILVALNDRDPVWHDVYRLNLRTGDRVLAAQNDIGAVGWHADYDFNVRVAETPTADGGFAVLHRNGGDDEWKPLTSWGAEDAMNTYCAGFAEDNQHLWLINSVGENTSALNRINLTSGEAEKVASDPDVDLGSMMVDPVTHQLEAISYIRAREEWQALDPEVAKDFEVLKATAPGDFSVINRDSTNKTWLVAFTLDNGPTPYYVFDRKTREAEFLFSSRPELETQPLVTMEPVLIKARDGLVLHGYLSRPKDVSGPMPAVLNVHGGPWARDHWGYRPEAQWLCNRGYACLQVNFRGSTGYGKAFINAADKEWGGAMQDDITDAAEWLVSEGIADPQRLAIFGGSYGGFAVLSGLTKTPDLYRCGVDIVGPSNILTWLETIPPYWKPFEALVHRRVGHPTEDKALLEERSPVNHVDKIQSPLLIVQGRNDPRVNREESLQIKAALEAAGKTVSFLEFDDEGHGFVKPENRLKFYAVAEVFLAEHLGGRCES